MLGRERVDAQHVHGHVHERGARVVVDLEQRAAQSVEVLQMRLGRVLLAVAREETAGNAPTPVALTCSQDGSSEDGAWGVPSGELRHVCNVCNEIFDRSTC